MLRAGSKANVIPDEAHLALNIRFQSEATKEKILRSITRIVRAECSAAGCPREPEIRTSAYFPATRNDELCEKVTRAVHEKLFGFDNVHDLPVSMGSEDFSMFGLPGDGRYVGDPVPYCYWTFGGHAPQTWDLAPGQTYLEKMGTLPGPHSSIFAPAPEDALRTGVTALTGAVLAFLPPYG
jgi:hippurate hydrolase